MLVIDANVAVHASQRSDDFAALDDDDLHAPALMWSEARSAIREAFWRGEIDEQLAGSARRAVERCPVKLHSGPELGEQAWKVAAELGLAKTYDAEYIALAQILGCQVVTLDMRLYRGAERLGIVITPAELRAQSNAPADRAREGDTPQPPRPPL